MRAKGQIPTFSKIDILTKNSNGTIILYKKMYINTTNMYMFVMCKETCKIPGGVTLESQNTRCHGNY